MYSFSWPITAHTPFYSQDVDYYDEFFCVAIYCVTTI